MSKIILIFAFCCALTIFSVDVTAKKHHHKKDSSSSSSSSSSESCSDSSSSSDSSDESRGCNGNNVRNNFNLQNGRFNIHSHTGNGVYKWDLSRMSVVEVEELKLWGQLHSISWTQIQAHNEFYRGKSHSNVGNIGDIEHLCISFDSSEESSDKEDHGIYDGVRGTLRAIGYFEEYKKAVDLRDALLKLKKLCDFVDSGEVNSAENVISKKP